MELQFLACPFPPLFSFLLVVANSPIANSEFLIFPRSQRFYCRNKIPLFITARRSLSLSLSLFLFSLHFFFIFFLRRSWIALCLSIEPPLWRPRVGFLPDFLHSLKRLDFPRCWNSYGKISPLGKFYSSSPVLSFFPPFLCEIFRVERTDCFPASRPGENNRGPQRGQQKRPILVRWLSGTILGKVTTSDHWLTTGWTLSMSSIRLRVSWQSKPASDTFGNRQKSTIQESMFELLRKKLKDLALTSNVQFRNFELFSEICQWSWI